MTDQRKEQTGVILGGYTSEEREAFIEAHLKVCRSKRRKRITAPSQSGAYRSERQSKRLCAKNHWRDKLKEEGRL